jgi:hypothetical protein
VMKKLSDHLEKKVDHLSDLHLVIRRGLACRSASCT